MKERPILFSAPMVRAILAGTKTQTRRILKPDGKYRLELVAPADGGPPRCPYGQPGDRLWVREAFSGKHDYDQEGGPPSAWFVRDPIWYWADGQPDSGDWTRPRPSIHMPRWASRIALEVTGVRVERLQDISEADALAEGVDMNEYIDMPYSPSMPHVTVTMKPRTGREAYAALWESINGPESWASNPWVWCVGFKRVEVAK